jgi:glycosyltransferase involved in cell wall biosynthesis
MKYIRLTRPTPTGSKLNLGIENSSGTILQKMDDDDYYGPRFLETSVARLQASRSRRAIAGWDCFLILLAGSPSLYFSGHGWLAGGTLSFRREVWESARFRDVRADEDAFFLDDNPGPRIRINAPEEYVLVRHGGNTWKAFRSGAGVDDYVRSLETYPKSVVALTGEESALFYSSLRPLSVSPG